MNKITRPLTQAEYQRIEEAGGFRLDEFAYRVDGVWTYPFLNCFGYRLWRVTFD